MDYAQLSTITDPDVLRELVVEKLAIIGARDESIRNRDIRIEALTQEIARLRRVQFSARSERMNPEQRALFDETMEADLAAAEAELSQLAQSSPDPTPAASVNAPKRRPLPPELPRVTTVHEPDCRGCEHCGAALVKIGEHVRERLACKPIEFFVQREVYPQYACRPCGRIIAQPVPAAILDRSQAGPSVLAQVTVAKYVDHLPLYRQEAIYARSGVHLPRSTLAEWIGAVGVALQPLVDATRRTLLTCPVLHADETPVAQLEPGRGQTRRAYVFAYAAHGWASGARGRMPGAARSVGEQPLIVFDYCTSRSGQHAQRFLREWRGSLMVDDYAGYKALFATGITELGCWAHARRKFVDLEKASGSPIATEAVRRIATLYRIEHEIQGADPETRHAHRQQYAAPAVAALHDWLRELHPKVLGSSGTARAIAYTLKRWPALVRYLDDGRYPIDNNPIENAIRPIALGRKNWLFAGSEPAGRRACAIMSLLATAKANGHEPHAWLSDVLERLPSTQDSDITCLLPHTWKPAR